MNNERKIENPICIRFGGSENVVLADEFTDQNTPLTPGVMFGGNHFGFVLITDTNGKQKETVYPTESKIAAVGNMNGNLKIFEEGKKYPWVFNKSGMSQSSKCGEYMDDCRSKADTVVENYDEFVEEKPVLKNPIRIKIAKNPYGSVILKDELVDKDYPLYPGVMFGTEHYGFIFIIETEDGEKEISYPTENNIIGIGMDDTVISKLKIYETGKYHPWVFTYKGELEKKASYEQYSRRDIAFVNEVYGVDVKTANDRFTLKLKKENKS